MRCCLAIATSLSFSAALVGCGKGAYQQNADFAEENISALNLFAEALESVKDRESAKAAAKKLDEVSKRIEQLAEKKGSLPKVTKREKDRFEKEYIPKIQAAGERVQKVAFSARVKSGGEPSFLAALERVQKSANLLAQ